MGVFGQEITLQEADEQKATGFASPAQGYEGRTFDFNKILISNPPATFIIRMGSGEMSNWGIFEGSLLVVDRSIRPANGHIVIIAHDGQFLCREARFFKQDAKFASDKREINLAHSEYTIFGVVKAVVRNLL